MYLKSSFIFTCIVWCSLPEWGKTWNVFTVSHGTFTTFPLIFFCPPRGAANTFMNGILGETSLHSTWCKSCRCCGISGKPIPFAVELGGIFFFFRWPTHVLQINLSLSLCSLCFISDTQECKAGQSGRLLLCIITTLCRYHNWSHTQHLCTGPFSTSLWKFFITSSSDSCLFLNDFFLFVSHCCSFFLYARSVLAIFMYILLHSRLLFLFSGSFLAISLLFLSHSRSVSLYNESFLAICILFLLHSRSLSLYTAFFLAICMLFLLHTRSLSLYTVFILAICMLILLHSRSLSLYTEFFLAIFILFLLLSRSISLRNGSFLASCMLFLLHIRSLSLCAASFLALCIFILLCCCSYSLNSGSDLARLFHSVLYFCLLSFSLTDLSLHISPAAFSTLWLSSWFFLALSAKSFCDCKYLSTIACASEGTFVESTTALFLLDDSSLFDDMHDAPSRLLFDICRSVSFDTLDVSTHFFDLLTSFSSVALASRLRTLSSFRRCLWLFFLTFGMTCQ